MRASLLALAKSIYYSLFADHPDVYLIKQSQFFKIDFLLKKVCSSFLGDRGDRELEQKKNRKIEAS